MGRPKGSKNKSTRSNRSTVVLIPPTNTTGALSVPVGGKSVQVKRGPDGTYRVPAEAVRFLLTRGWRRFADVPAAAPQTETPAAPETGSTAAEE